MNVSTPPPGSFGVYRDAFRRALNAESVSPRTIGTYTESLDRLATFLSRSGTPPAVADIRREHIEGWVLWMRDEMHWSGNTVKNRFRGAARFFNWLVDLGELDRSPMTKMRVPRVESVEVPVVPDSDLASLLRACDGRDFRARRDLALVLSLLDTGLRVSEMASIKLQPSAAHDSYFDIDEGVLWVMGKGRRQRRVPLGRKARKAIDAYLFARNRHAKAESPFLWLGERGQLGASGIYQILASRCEEAGIGRVHPHQLRHTFAHKMVQANVNDSDLMYLAGWKDRGMLTRYGASAAGDRAIEAHRRASPADNLA